MTALFQKLYKILSQYVRAFEGHEKKTQRLNKFSFICVVMLRVCLCFVCVFSDNRAESFPEL